MNVEALAENFASFLGKHSGELRLVGSALETIISNLPIDPQDKAGILSIADRLQQSATNIAAGAASLSAAISGNQETEVVVSKADVEEAVHDELVNEGVISGHGEAPGNAPGGGAASNG